MIFNNFTDFINAHRNNEQCFLVLLLFLLIFFLFLGFLCWLENRGSGATLPLTGNVWSQDEDFKTKISLGKSLLCRRKHAI